MSWEIQCPETACSTNTWVANIVDLIKDHTDSNGWFVCTCGSKGYVEKSYALQDPGEIWEPYLRGILPLGEPGNTYQPFVFLVSYEPMGPVTDIWFSYYEDLRATGGKLKLGHGPGGPPVLGKQSVLALLSHLHNIQYVTEEEVLDALRTAAP
jgi:hypothetical protein